MPDKHFLLPDYALNFQCRRCTECCKRWSIVFDRQSVKKYEQLVAQDEELTSLLRESLKRDKNGWATVRLQNRVKSPSARLAGEAKEEIEAAVCPFLDKDGLCLIQKKFGGEALSDTCKIFPRNIFLTERGWEISLTYACHEAAATLKNKNPVEFYQDPAGFDFPALHGQYGKIGGPLDRKRAGKSNYFKIEELLIDIMQFREMDIDARIILTGLIINKLKNGDFAGIKRYLANIDTALAGQLHSMPGQPVYMMKLIKEAVDRRLFTKVTEKDMGRLLIMAYNELKLLDREVISAEKVHRLLEGYMKYYLPHAGTISHVYENYFVNFIFSKKFFTHKYGDAYFLMVFFYILSRFFCICVCMAEERQVDEDLLVNVISAVERSIGHSQAYYESVLHLIKKGGYHRLPYVVSLINLACQPAVSLGQAESG